MQPSLGPTVYRTSDGFLLAAVIVAIVESGPPWKVNVKAFDGGGGPDIFVANAIARDGGDGTWFCTPPE